MWSDILSRASLAGLEQGGAELLTLSLGRLSPSRADLLHSRGPEQSCNNFPGETPLPEHYTYMGEIVPWSRAVNCYAYSDLVAFPGSCRPESLSIQAATLTYSAAVRCLDRLEGVLPGLLGCSLFP